MVAFSADRVLIRGQDLGAISAHDVRRFYVLLAGQAGACKAYGDRGDTGLVDGAFKSNSRMRSGAHLPLILNSVGEAYHV